MADSCAQYVSTDDLKAAKESILHIEHVATSKDANGNPALVVTDLIRGVGYTNATLDGLFSDIGFKPVNGSFEDGGTLVNRWDVLLYETNGAFYQWMGDIPSGGLVVSAGSSPFDSSGGLLTGWVDRTDLTLRSQLAAPNGYTLVGGLDNAELMSSLNYSYGLPNVITGVTSRTLQNRLEDQVHAKDFGASNSKTAAENTAALQDAINSGASVIDYSGLNITVNVGAIMLASNQEHRGNGATITHNDDLMGRAIFNGISKNNIYIHGFKFSGPNSETTAINAVSCNDVTVENNSTTNIGLFSCKPAKAPNPLITNDVSSTYALITDDADYCHNIKVVKNTIKGDGTGVLGGPFKVAAVLMNYAKGFTVANNFITGHKEGIQWWGGDGLNAAEGASSLSADRKCYDGTIVGNIVYNTVGGIWGAMGTRVVVNGNTVVGCKDVCIDFESCVDCSATGNTAADAANGALTVIGLSGNITFADNICTGAGSNNFYVIGGVYYTGTVGGLMNVSFINNTFRSTAGNTQAFVKVENCAFVTFHGNKFENVRLDIGTFSTALSQSQKITDNEFIFTKGGTFTFTALTFGGLVSGKVEASRNRIDQYSSSTGQFGMRYLVNKSGQLAITALITSNFVTGFGADLQIEATAPVSGKHFASYQNNIFNTIGGTVDAANITLQGANNYNSSGVIVAYP